MNGTEKPCPCGIGQNYIDHCGKIHRGGAGLGVGAEALMRARYSAYVLKDRDFLLSSWHPATRPAGVDFDDALEWLGLEVIDTSQGTGFDTTGTVEFRARFRRREQNLELHENSRFERVDGRWVYVSGD